MVMVARNLTIFASFLFLASGISGEIHVVNYATHRYPSGIDRNKLSLDHLLLYHSSNNLLSFSGGVYLEKHKDYSPVFLTRLAPLPDYILHLSGGNFFLDPVFNQSIFLSDDFSGDAGIFKKRQFPVYSISFARKNSSFPEIGAMHFKRDESGLFFKKDDHILFYSFPHQYWLVLSRQNTFLGTTYLNLAGEKNNAYGYLIHEFTSSSLNISFSLSRKTYWDYYEYATDDYTEGSKGKKSYLLSSEVSFSGWNNSLNAFKKGNHFFLKNETSYSFNLPGFFTLLTGGSYFHHEYEEQHYKYTLLPFAGFGYPSGKNLGFLSKFYFSKKKKFFYQNIFFQERYHLFSLGMYYVPMEETAHQPDFDFLMAGGFEAEKSIFLDRVYFAFFSEYRFHSEAHTVTIRLSFTRKKIASYYREKLYLESKMKFTL